MAFTRPKAAQIDFDITNITDPLIRLNSGQSGSADKDVGIVIERGSDTNVALIWDESTDSFAVINTSEDGSTSGDVTISSYADLTLKKLTQSEQQYTTSNMMKFNQIYTGASAGSYFTQNEYQKILTIIPSADSENYQISGRILAQSAGSIQTIEFTAALRSGTLPDLDWSITYTDTHNGSAFFKPQLWTKETTTAGFIIAIQKISSGDLYGTVTVDIDVIPRTSSQKSNVTMNTTQDSETTSVDTGYTANDMTKIMEINGDNIDISAHDGSSNGLELAGTLVTATAAEINYLDGVTGITLGSANELLVVGTDGSSIASDSTLAVDTSNNRLGINQTSPEVTLHMTGEGAQTAQIRMEQHNDTADAPDIRTRKSRGTAASSTKNNAGDFIFRGNFERYNGSAYTTVGQLAVDTNSSNADRFQLTLAVSEDGASVDAANAQLKIDGNDSGAITFNGAYKFPTADGSANQVLQTDGSGALSFATVAGGSSQWTTTGSDIYYNTGNVGIGTSSPGAELDIESTSPDIHLNDSDGVLGGAITSRLVFQASGTTHGTVGFGTSGGNMGLSNNQGPLFLQADTNNAHSNSYITFTVDNSAKMRITSTGNVGIGTTAPSGKLHVTTASSGVTPNTTGDELFVEGSGNSGITIGSGTSSNGRLYFGDSGNAVAGRVGYDHTDNSLYFGTNGVNEHMTIDSSGNVGIGTTPAGGVQLDVRGTGVLQLVNTDTVQLIASNGGSTLKNVSNNPLIFGTNNTERMRINSSGNVGIGTTAPSTALEVSGTVTATTFDGEATSAQYADLAERYEADAEYPTGTVMIFGGEKEVTQSTSKMDRRKAGVVSEKPAFMMNSNLVETVEHAPYIALQGRVPVRVIGEVRKGDLMITSSVPGCAEAWCEEGDPRYGSVIGKSLVHKTTTEEELIEVVIGVN